MTVTDLINQLRQLPPDTIVLALNKDKYFDEVSEATATPVRKMIHYSDYREAAKVQQGDDRFYAPAIQGVVIR